MGKKKHKKPKIVARPTGAVTPPARVAQLSLPDTFHSRLEWALLIFIGILPFVFIPGVQLRMIAIYMVGVLFTLIFFAYILYGQSRGYIRVPRLGLFWFVVAWLVVRVIAAVHSGSFVLSTLEYYEGSWSDGLLFSLCQLLLGYSIVSLQPGKGFLEKLSMFIVPQATVIGMINIGMAVQAGWPHVLPRPISLLQNADAYTAYFFLTVPFVFGALWQVIRSRTHSLYKWGMGAAALVVALGFFVLLPAELQQIVIKSPIKTAAAVSSENPSTASAQTFLTDPSNAQRYNLWKLGLVIAKESPAIGVGPGMARFQFYHALDTFNPPLAWNYSADVAMSYPHNELINQADTSGLGGLFLYLCIWISVLYLVIRYRNTVAPENKLFYWMGIAALSLYFAFNLGYFQIAITGIYSVILIALLLSLVAQDNYHEKFRWPWASYITSGLVLTLACVAVGYVFEEISAQSDLDLSQSSLYVNNVATSTQLAVDAAETFPYTAYYQANAADICYNLALSPPAGMSNDERTQLAIQSLSLADNAVSLEPTNPNYKLLQGAAYYLLNTDGSDASNRGIADLRQAIAMGDHFFNISLQAAHVAHFKGDIALTKEFGADAVRVAPAENKAAVQKEVDTLLQTPTN